MTIEASFPFLPRTKRECQAAKFPQGGWLCTGRVTYASLCLKSRVGTDTVSAGKTWVTLAEKKLDRAGEWVIDKWQQWDCLPNWRYCMARTVFKRLLYHEHFSG